MNNKLALITGGSKGIGLEAVKRFHNLGYSVITCARNAKIWGQVLKQNPDLKNVDFLETDLSDNANIGQMFSHIRSNYGELAIAVNNASPKIESGGLFSEVPEDSLFSTLISDFWSHALCLKYELQIMKTGATIVNVSSINGFRATPNGAMYSGAKHGIEGLTKSVALEAIELGIRINSVAPGATWTPRWEQRQADINPNIREEVENMIPIKRFAKPSEIVDAIEWLTSERSCYVVGHTLVVDGGMSLG